MTHDPRPTTQDLHSQDPEVAELIDAEQKRQSDVIRLIASENYTSPAVREATASVFTNKYSEGYPGKRYYEGQENTDKLERLTIKRGRELFGADHMNVQPYSGSPANLAAYNALADPGDTLLAMGLPFGGHLTHGWKVSVTGKYYDAHHYAVDRDTERIDLEEVSELADEVDPEILICGSSAYPREIDYEGFREIADSVDAYLLADIAHVSGLVAADVHASPIGIADVVTSTTHKTLRGPRSGMIMCTEEVADDIDKSVFPGLQGGPHMHTIAGLAVAFQEANSSAFRDYAEQIVDNAEALGEALEDRGYRLVADGTDKHLIVADIAQKGLGGKKASSALARAGLVCNANTIPFDERSPFDPSGLRFGTSCVTTRGMEEEQMNQIAGWIDDVLSNIDDESLHEEIRSEVESFCAEYPVVSESSS
jgi:glycine hydroxymethyltransferase